MALSFWNKSWSVACATLFLSSLSAVPAYGACTLASADTWNGAVSSDWSTGGNWSGTVPTGATNACITNSTNNPVTLGSAGNVASLQLGSTNSLNINGTLAIAGADLINDGAIALNSALELTGNLTLSGAGTMTMTGVPSPTSGGQIGTNSNGFLLTNQSTIQGSGLIGSNVGALFQNLNLNNSGAINANSTANALVIAGSGTSFANSGTFEATGGGTLGLSTPAAINNNGGLILSDGIGSAVNVSTTIAGGTLTTANGGVIQTMASGATLDALNHGAITISDGSTYTAAAGTTHITGQLNLGTISGGTLALGGQLQLVGNTTFSGPGVVTMTGNSSVPSGGQIGTNSNGFVLTNLSIIQGSGLIGSNAGVLFQNLSLANSETINANTGGATLEIGGNGSSIVNSGLLEATNGGILTLATTSALNNNGGNITASGGGSTVNVSNTTIQGGTLNTVGGGVMQTVASGATLDALNHGAITISDGSTYTAAAGTTHITGQLNLGTISGGTLALGGQLQLVGNTTFSGPGVVTMTGNSSVPSGGQIGTNSNGFVLTNLSIIQGSGLIGSNAGVLFQNLSLSNSGTINANTNGATLEIGGNGSSIVNGGLLEATNGGILTLATTSALNNNGGNITASGGGSTVNVSNTTIQGGTLNTVGGGVMQTVGTSILDGSTVNGAVTISDGSTYTSGATAITRTSGTLNLGTSAGGGLALGGVMELVGNTTLSGPGALTMSGSAQIGTNSNAFILTNHSTITGTGLMGSNAGVLFSNGSVNNQGSIIANGGTLTVAETGGITNTGTLQASAGSTLIVTAPVSASTFSGTTLHTGTYNAFSGGTIQLTSLGTTGGEIHSNNGTILLDGVNSNIVDHNSLDALSNLSDNSGSFTIRNGRDFTSLSPFSNEGILQIGSGSTFFTGNGGGGSYTQTAGTTTVDGTLDPLHVDIFSGLLDGAGSIDGALTVDLGGVVTPGDAGSTGTLTDIGDFTLNGTLDIGIGSTGNDLLDVTGQANLGGTLELVALDGFTLASGDTFFLLEDGTRNGMFNTVDTAGLDLGPGLTAEVLYDQGAGNNEVELVINGATAATPEPGTWFMLTVGLGALVLLRRKVVRA